MNIFPSVVAVPAGTGVVGVFASCVALSDNSATLEDVRVALDGGVIQVVARPVVDKVEKTEVVARPVVEVPSAWDQVAKSIALDRFHPTDTIEDIRARCEARC